MNIITVVLIFVILIVGVNFWRRDEALPEHIETGDSSPRIERNVFQAGETGSSFVSVAVADSAKAEDGISVKKYN